MNACVHTYTKPQTSSTRSRGLGWRIHESVEDTKLSTNKQHTLSQTQCEKLGAACDLQRILSLNENTSKPMHHCSALPATFNCYCHSNDKTSKMNYCSALSATFNCYCHQINQPFIVLTETKFSNLMAVGIEGRRQR